MFINVFNNIYAPIQAAMGGLNGSMTALTLEGGWGVCDEVYPGVLGSDVLG